VSTNGKNPDRRRIAPGLWMIDGYLARRDERALGWTNSTRWVITHAGKHISDVATLRDAREFIAGRLGEAGR